MNDLLVVLPDSIDERLLEGLNQDDGVHGPPVSLARRPGVVHLLSISTRVIRPLNVMVTSACDRGTAPTGATTSQTGGFPSA